MRITEHSQYISIETNGRTEIADPDLRWYDPDLRCDPDAFDRDADGLPLSLSDDGQHGILGSIYDLY